LAAESARLQQAGLDPAYIAARTLTAIREDELYGSRIRKCTMR